jgi:hypothetical protein
MKMLSGVNPIEPWAQIDDLTTYLSAAGIHLPKPLIISYEFLIVDGSPPLKLRVLLDKYPTGYPWGARWRAELYYGAGGVLATAYAIQPYPQQRVYIDTWQYTIPEPPYTGTSPPRLGFAPANYAEGGSPYN